jgi:(1->4)-alpha-D-glucan 1-alpha-D-glucosylmutase
MTMGEEALRMLAARYGITVDGVEQDTGGDAAIEALIMLLSDIGLPIMSPADTAEQLEREHLQEWQRMILDPVLVVEEGTQPLTIPIRLPAEVNQHIDWTLIEENGNRHGDRFQPAELAVGTRYETRTQKFVQRILALDINLPCGSHDFQLHITDLPDETVPSLSLKLIITPASCYVPPGIAGDDRIWGLGVHLHALRSRRNWGLGDYSDLKQIIALGAEHGAGTVCTTPLHAPLRPATGPPNPYRASCRSLFDIGFLDVEAIPDLVECDEALHLMGDAQFQARLTSLRDGDEIDFDAVSQTKLEVLRLLWRHFTTNHLNPETERGRSFRQFQIQGGVLLRSYGIFTAIRNVFQAETIYGTDWYAWPAEFRDPHSQAVADFAAQHTDEIEFHHYQQWQAELQMAAIGRRSMELGLKVGLMSELTFGPGVGGFESWYYQGLFLPQAETGGYPGDDTGQNPAGGLAVPLPTRLKNLQYAPLIDALRTSMRYSGALVIRGLAHYHQSSIILAGQKLPASITITLPFSDLIAIIALESQRNRCLVLADTLDLLPQELQNVLQNKQIFAQQFLLPAQTAEGNLSDRADFQKNMLICASPPFLATIRGCWHGKDIVIKTDQKIFKNDAAMEKAIIARSAARVHLLIALHHADLLPEGYELDPAFVPDIDQVLFRALQIFLARTSARILLMYLNDLLGMEDQAMPPQAVDQTFWLTRYPLHLEKIQSASEILSLYHDLCRERGIGVIRPSAPAADRKQQKGVTLPKAFYRLQLHKDFTFLQAAAIIPYLKQLGISHCYASPFLKARPGSLHGYNIIDHAEINPEIGSRENFEYLIATLEQHHMALLLDIVPNHMGIGSDNQWWMDVLENGQATIHADFFDINWQPLQPELAGRLLLPVLGDHYGTVLENNELSLLYHPGSGSFSICYYEHRFPVAPETYPVILSHDIQRLERRLGKQHGGYLELQNLISSFTNLPPCSTTSDDKRQMRPRNKEVNKRILARLCRDHPELTQFIAENVFLFNGEPGKPESYDLLHDLLEKQPYRLAYWRVAVDEINYRRFFDINELAGLRMEKLQVFQETHRLILDLINTGKLDGLRIDHPDGLFDPHEYFLRLQAAVTGEPLENPHANREPQRAPLYVVTEKILSDFEHLPDMWPVNGTTGYDFSNMLNGLFVDASAEKSMTAIYHRVIGRRMQFNEILYASKKLIIRSAMAGELNVLTSLLYRLAQSTRRTRDFTLNRLRDALTEIVASFPVYRTYIAPGKPMKRDINFINWAVGKAKKRQRLQDITVFDFIRSVLLSDKSEKDSSRRNHLEFVMKLQQYTAPVMAKGMEDTSFYIYNRLLSLNEVGGNPKRFGTSVAAFHRTNQDRMRHWPHAMLNTSTHDSKRNEDVRARINVLTEVATEWQDHVVRWSKLNRPLKSRLQDRLAPTRNDEYAFYQNLLGVWPLQISTNGERREFTRRMTDYMLKAVRESKEQTSWIQPDKAYEQALVRFVEETLAANNNAFLDDFLSFQEIISWFGMLNSLSQVLLKSVVPGIPDIYQGNEIWRFCLVDPDNRRAVDFDKRRAILNGLLAKMETSPDERSLFLQQLLDTMEDGRAKMYTTAQALRCRNLWSDVFEQGDYLPLEVRGENGMHLCTFARKAGARLVVAAAPRLYCKLLQGRKILPLGKPVWSDTAIQLPAEWAGVEFQNVFSAEHVRATTDERPLLSASQVLARWPVGLLQATL